MKKPVSIIAATTSVVLALTSCMNINDKTTQSIESTPVTQIVTSETLETSSDVTSIETTENLGAVYAAPRNNPLDDYSSFEVYCIVDPYDYKVDVSYGFDNAYTISKLRDYVYEVTGSQDNEITLSDVNYFQYTGYFDGNYGSYKFSTYPDVTATPLYTEAIRAILSSQGLRFGIDEIPASFIQERFPRYYYDAIVFNKFNKCCVEEVSEPIADPLTLNSIFEAPSIMDRDYDLFRACLMYNYIRSCYMYDNPYGTGPIQQVRDASTGMNVLVPTESQIEELQQDINSIPGCENINIFVPESPQDFYDYYGYYPSELVDDRYVDNTPEGFAEYYSSLSDSEKVELYTPKPSDLIYTGADAEIVYYLPSENYGEPYTTETE